VKPAKRGGTVKREKRDFQFPIFNCQIKMKMRPSETGNDLSHGVKKMIDEKRDFGYC
jgi:hypothetical protein